MQSRKSMAASQKLNFNRNRNACAVDVGEMLRYLINVITGNGEQVRRWGLIAKSFSFVENVAYLMFISIPEAALFYYY